MSNLDLSLKISADASDAVKALDVLEKKLATLTAAKPAANASAGAVATYQAEVDATKAAIVAKQALIAAATKTQATAEQVAATQTTATQVAAAKDAAAQKAAIEDAAIKSSATKHKAAAAGAALGAPGVAAGVAGAAAVAVPAVSLGGSASPALKELGGAAVVAEAAVAGLNKTMGPGIADSSKKAKEGLGGIAGMLTSVKSLYALAAGEAVKFMHEAMSASSEFEESFASLQTLANNSGVSFTKLWEIIKHTTEGGKVTQDAAIAAVKDLLEAHATITQIEQLMTAMPVVAQTSRKDGLSISDAVQTGARGILMDEPRALRALGISKQLVAINDDYARTIPKVATELDTYEKIQAKVEEITRKAATATAGAVKPGNEYGESVQRLSGAWEMLKNRIGSSMATIGTPVVEMFTSILNVGIAPLEVALDAVINSFRVLGEVFGGLALWVTGKIDFSGFIKQFSDAGDAAVQRIKDSTAYKTVARIWGGEEPAAPTPTPASAAGLPPLPPIPPLKPGERGLQLPPLLDPNTDPSKLPTPQYRDGSVTGPTNGVKIVDKQNPAGAAETAKEVSDTDAKIDSKAKQDALAREKAFQVALQDMRLSMRKSDGEEELAIVKEQESRRTIDLYAGVTKEAVIEARNLDEQERAIIASQGRIREAQKANTLANGKPLDLTTDDALRTEYTATVTELAKVASARRLLATKTENDIYAVKVKLDGEAADKAIAGYQTEMETEKTAFEAALAMRKALLDKSLAAHLITQADYNAEVKKMALEAIDEEVSQSENKKAQLQTKLASLPTSEITQKEQITQEIVRLDAVIAASADKRAAAEHTAATATIADLQKVADAKKALAVQELQLQGKVGDAAKLTITNDLEKFKQDYAGHPDLIAQKQSIADMQLQQADFTEYKRILDAKVAAETQAETTINRLVAEGQMTQDTADKKILAGRLAAGAAIESNAQALEALAKLYPDDLQMAALAAAAREASDSLKTNLDKMATSVNRTLADSVGNRFKDWVTGVSTFGEAVKGVFADVFGNIASSYLKKFSNELFVSLEGGGGKDGKGGGQGIGGMLTKGIDSLFSKDGPLGSLIKGMGSMLESAFSGLGSMFSGSGAGAGGSSMWSGVSAMFGFREGGFTGFGSDDEPAGFVHKNEHVTPADDVRRFGGPRAMAELGMLIRSGWRLPGYKTGGMVGGSSSSGQFASAMQLLSPSFNPTINNSANLYLNPDDISNALGQHAGFERNLVRIIIKNKGKLGL